MGGKKINLQHPQHSLGGEAYLLHREPGAFPGLCFSTSTDREVTFLSTLHCLNPVGVGWLSGEHDSAGADKGHPVLRVQTQRPRQHDALDIASDCHKLCGGV